MVFTKVTKDAIKTSKYASDLRKFFSGELDKNQHTTAEDKADEKKRLRQNLIQIIIDKYPLDYGKEVNFARFSNHELNSIAEYGDHRAEIDPEFIDIDYSPIYYQDSSGNSVISHNTIDLEFKDIFQEKIALQLGGFGMKYCLQVTRPRTKDSGYLNRKRDYRRILKGLPMKYNRATQFLLNEKLDEVAKMSMSYYTKKAKLYLAAVVLQLMRSYKEEAVASVGIQEICQDFGIQTSGMTKFFQVAIDQHDFLQSIDRRSCINSIVQKKKKIKKTYSVKCG